MLSTVYITKAKDEQGNEITPLLEFDHGLVRCVFPQNLEMTCYDSDISCAVSHAKDFPCNLSARSKTARKLVFNAVESIDG